MTDIPLPNDNTDIYSLGFDKSLNRVVIGNEPLSSVYSNGYSGLSNEPAQGIGFGALAAGIGESMFIMDPSKGLSLGSSTFENAPFRVDMEGNLVAESVTINGILLATQGTFGGDGSDGVLTITSGTTTLSAASERFLLKNYTSISITGTGALGFSNPNTNGTIIILKSQGDVTLTSSTAPMIDASSMGGQNVVGGTGNLGRTSVVPHICNPGNEGANGINGGNAGGGSAPTGVNSNNPTIVFPTALDSGYVPLSCGGAGGAGGDSQDGSGVEGVGGKGGGALYIQCAGVLNFTTASGISVAGGAGTTAGSAGTGGGGGGGGAGGTCVVLYNSLASASGSITVAGGNGATGQTGGTSSPGSGGAGGNGTSGNANGGAGGDGGSASGAGGSGGGGGGSGGAYVFGTSNGSAGAAGGNTGTVNQAPGGGGGGGASGYALITSNISFA